MKCPSCQSENTTKVISMLLPMKFCDDCSTLWGEPFVTIFTYTVAPIEAFFTGQWCMVAYNGSYLYGVKAYIQALFGDDE